ncbi:hypothetical protein XENTR_v10023846 [Xenopus tropicalis]|nr:hypothetical protein XENTR_v10023846 [Xenopus tropicalis]
MAPEFFAADDKPYGMAVDWWALGVVIYVLLMYKFPFDDENDGAVTQSILYDEPEYTDELSKDANDFMMNVSYHQDICIFQLFCDLLSQDQTHCEVLCLFLYLSLLL